MSGFFKIEETDFGSKARAISATEAFPKQLSADLKWRTRLWWERVLITAQYLCLAWKCWETGTLYSTIRLEQADKVAGANFEVIGTPDNVFTNVAIIAGGLYINPKTGRICDYAQAVHDGHFTRSGNWVPERPFITEAINMHIGEFYQLIDKSISETESKVWIGE